MALLASFLPALGIKHYSQNFAISCNNGQLSVPGSNDEEIARDVWISAAHRQKKINVCQAESGKISSKAEGSRISVFKLYKNYYKGPSTKAAILSILSGQESLLKSVGHIKLEASLGSGCKSPYLVPFRAYHSGKWLYSLSPVRA